MRDWLRQRPWIWILLLIGVLLSLSAAFVYIAQKDPPIPVDQSAATLPDHDLAEA